MKAILEFARAIAAVMLASLGALAATLSPLKRAGMEAQIAAAEAQKFAADQAAGSGDLRSRAAEMDAASARAEAAGHSMSAECADPMRAARPYFHARGLNLYDGAVDVSVVDTAGGRHMWRAQLD